MNIREIAVSRLKEYENNPRNNDLAVEKVKYSIERFGFMFPIVIDINYVIVCGHTRVRACKELGIQSVPCIIADELTEEQINLFRLVDNKSGEYTDWDFEKLKKELSLVDLTLEKNQLLLDRFELSTEAFDIEAEQAEIKIPAYNFMGVEDKAKVRKASVSTVSSDTISEIEDDDYDEPVNNVGNSNADTVTVPEEVISAEPVPSAQKEQARETANEVSANVSNAETSNSTETSEVKRAAAPTLIQFRFGDIAFFISQIELDRLNDKYSEYIDSGEAFKDSFVNFLLKGVENND